MSIPFSVLDLMPTRPDDSHAQTMRKTVQAAQAAERFGFNRFWVAEHHNAGSLLSSATVVVMAELAAATERIRVGSGGIMLPNHAPYVVAEQFGTLEAFHPGRIDLGLGRAPGTDPMTAQALRRDNSAAINFPAEVEEIQRYLGEPSPMRRVHAIPGQGSNVPLYILGHQLSGLLWRLSWVCRSRLLHTSPRLPCRMRSMSTAITSPRLKPWINPTLLWAQGRWLPKRMSRRSIFSRLRNSTP